VQDSFYFEVLSSKSVSFVPVKFGEACFSAEILNGSDALQLPPPAFSMSLNQAFAFPNTKTTRDNFDVTNVVEYEEAQDLCAQL
jgi:hypothetical protein